MSALTITIVQAELYWHRPADNLAQFEETITALDTQSDIVVLPEMFTTGFTMDAAANAEPMDGASVDWMRHMAAESGAAVCGSLIIRDGKHYYNRFVFVRPDGSLQHYDKRHLFRLADEQRHYSAGKDLVSIEWLGWRIRPMICYDLRFPVWSRNCNSYDLMLYVANWPSRRHLAWETLLRARAIENLAYVAGVNRSGVDGNDLPYAGGSAVIDYLGNELVSLRERTGAASATLDLQELMAFRDKFAFHEDADDFELSDRAPPGAA